MVRKDDILGRVRVAAPCKRSWEWMEGDDRTRFCSSCNLNVYNLSGMPRKEADALVSAIEGRLCVRYFQRTDGTIITRDCPVGLACIRKRIATVVACTLTMFLSLYAFAARSTKLSEFGNDRYSFQDIRDRVRQTEPIQTIVKWIDPVQVTQGEVVVGKLVAPMPPPKQTGKK